MDNCALVAESSPDPSSQVGCVVYNHYGTSCGLGMNSFPPKMRVDLAYYQNRELKYDRVVHAEMRALLMAGNQAKGGSLYCTHPPCKDCAKHICDAGITHVYLLQSALGGEWARRCSASVQVAMQLFAECEVNVVTLPDV